MIRTRLLLCLVLLALCLSHFTHALEASRMSSTEKAEFLIGFAKKLSVESTPLKCDVFRQSGNAETFRTLLEGKFGAENIESTLHDIMGTELQDAANSCFKDQIQNDYVAFLLFLNSRKFKQYLIEEKKKALVYLLGLAAQSKSLTGPDLYEVVTGNDSNEAWCPALPQAFARGIDCIVSDPTATEKLKQDWTNASETLEEAIESTNTWMWDVSNPKHAGTQYWESPESLRSMDQCSTGDVAVWQNIGSNRNRPRKSGNGHITVVVSDSGNTIGGNESGGIRFKEPNELLGNPYPGGKSWLGCIPIWAERPF